MLINLFRKIKDLEMTIAGLETTIEEMKNEIKMYEGMAREWNAKMREHKASVSCARCKHLITTLGSDYGCKLDFQCQDREEK